MCGICSAFHAYVPTCEYEGLPAAGMTVENLEGAESGSERMVSDTVFTNAQIAQVLTDGYWEEFRGQGRRSLEDAEDGVLTYDVFGLTAEGQALARFAVEAWAAVMDVEFVELQATSEAELTGGDASDFQVLAQTVDIDQRIAGIWDGPDTDIYAVDLVAGETYTVSLIGLNVIDYELTILDSNSQFVQGQQSTTSSGVVQLTITPDESGTFYLNAISEGLEGADATYSLVVTEGVETFDRPDITFDDSREGAFANNGTAFAFINVEEDWTDRFGSTLDSYTFETYIHEIGHALGLGHSGFYNATDEGDTVTNTFEDDAHYLNDSRQASVMSYWSQTQNTFIDASFAYIMTPMIADTLAIEELYGSATIRDGNTVYGANSNVEGYLGLLSAILFDGEVNADLYAGGPIALTIADTGGVDTLDLSTVDDAQRVDLAAGGISNVAGLIGNVVIAEDTVIERFEGGSAQDKVFGNDADNRLDGNGGDDILRGRSGDDLVRGGAGDDALYGGSGNDEVRGGSGDDDVIGSSGRDLLYGNGGDDDLEGGSEADELRGHDGVDRLWGDAGGDYLSGGGGNDRLFGGDARDFVYGGRDDDRLAGEAGSDRLYGQSGDDYLIGGADTDWLYGGTGADTFLFGETFDRDLVRDFEDNVDTLFINDNLWSGDRSVTQVLADFAQAVDGDVVFDFGAGDVLVVENVASVDALADDLVIV